jgi:transposase InsO family protein
MCRVLEVSRSGYYASRNRIRPTPREVADADLADDIRRISEESRGTYGRPRIVVKLQGEGHTAGKGRVARLMKANEIKGRVCRRFRVTTDSDHEWPLAPNTLDRAFDVESVDSAWCADITYIWTGAGWVYLAAIIDLATRMIVGWSMARHMRTELIEDAFLNALSWRRPEGRLLHHSDRGSQYASESYRKLLESHDIECSMSRKGNCWDNAVMESFFGTYKQEWAHHHQWRGLTDARAATHDYIEVFYNRQRLHSSLGYRTPMEVDRDAG